MGDESVIGMYGPSWPQRVDRRAERGPYEPHDEPAFSTDAKTLGDALVHYGDHFQVTISPYDGSIQAVPFATGDPPRYFFYTPTTGDQMLVDIHIHRNGEWFCPKQDLGFAMNDGDVVSLGQLIC